MLLIELLKDNTSDRQFLTKSKEEEKLKNSTSTSKSIYDIIISIMFSLVQCFHSTYILIAQPKWRTPKEFARKSVASIFLVSKVRKISSSIVPCFCALTYALIAKSIIIFLSLIMIRNSILLPSSMELIRRFC